MKKALNYFLRTQVKNRDLIRAHDAADRLFEAFTPVWKVLIDNQRLFSASLYWRRILEFIDKWEKRNSCKIHKGTPFGFWALSELLLGDSKAGFMLMHRALEEDKRYHLTRGLRGRVRTPGADFVRLDITNRGSFFRSVVLRMRKPLSKRIRIYNRDLQQNLNLRIFERKFSRVSDLEEAALFFNVSHISMMRLRQLFKLKIGRSNLARHIFLETLFNFCKVAETIARKTSAAQPDPSRFSIKNFIEKLKPYAGWRINVTQIANDVASKMDSNRNNASDIELQLENFLNRNLVTRSRTTVPPELSDCLLLYGFRNYAAHDIKETPEILTERYNEVSQIVYNGLFFIIENYHLI